MRLLLLTWHEQLRRPLASLLLAGLCLMGGLLSALTWDLGRYGTELMRLLLLGPGESLQVDVFPRPAVSIKGIGLHRPVLSDDDVQWLRQLPGLRHCQVIHAVPVPATLHVQVAGILDNSQFLSLYGIAADDMPIELQEQWAQANLDEPIPFVFNPQVMRYYNLGMADRYSLPRLEVSILLDREFRMVVGSDLFRRLDNAFQVPVRVAGTNAAIIPWGIALPKHLTDHFLTELFPNGPPATAAPVQARLQAASGQDLASIQAAIKARGLSLQGEQQLADVVRNLERLVHLAAGVVALMLGLVIVVACLAQASALMQERRRQIACYRLCGAHTGHLLVIFGGGLAGICMLAAMLGAWLGGPLLAPLVTPLVQAFDVAAVAPPVEASQHRVWIAGLAGWACAGIAMLPALNVLRRDPLHLQREQ